MSASKEHDTVVMMSKLADEHVDSQMDGCIDEKRAVERGREIERGRDGEIEIERERESLCVLDAHTPFFVSHRCFRS